jgi:hypothetical protein
MARRGRWRRRLAAAAVAGGAVLLGLGSASAAGPADSKVRGADTRSQAVISQAVRASPTVAALLLTLERTDVIVIVQVTLIPGSLAGDLRLLASVDGCRYVMIRLNSMRSPEEQMEALGHELQHANEVAGASDVRDEAALARLMARIGRATGRGTFETDAAVRVGRLVRGELCRR